MAKFEVHIPAAAPDLPNVTLRVVADNWMAALKTGMEKVGEQGVHISNILCDIIEDGSFDITDPKTGRVFRIRELKGAEGRSAPPSKEALAPVRNEDLDREEATDPELEVPAFRAGGSGERTQVATAAEISAPQRRDDPAPIPLEKVTSKPPPPARAAPAPVAPKKPTPTPSSPAPEGPRRPTPAAASPARPSQRVSADPPAAKVIAEETTPLRPASIRRPAEKAAPKPAADWEVATTASYPKHDKPIGRPRSVEVVEAPSKPIVKPIGRISKITPPPDPEEIFAELFERVQDAESMKSSEAMYFFLDLALEKIRAESGSVLLAPLGASDLRFAAARGPKAKDLLRMNPKVPLGKGIAGFCAQESVSVAISDAQKDKRFLKQISSRVGYETRSMICAPMAVSGKTYGCLQVINKQGNAPFEDGELAILSYLAHQAAKYVESHGT